MNATFWRWFPLALGAAMVGGLCFMAAVAVRDPSFAVEQDYYRKAVAWDDTQAQATENAKLDWSVELELDPRGSELWLRARVKDSRGVVIPDAQVDVEAFANARAAQVVRATLVQERDAHATRVPLVRSGLWELRFTVQARGERFTQTIRRDVRTGDRS